MRISDRYASAVRSSCLVVDPRTRFSDTDTLGAYGIADRRLTAQGHGLAVALERLFTGAGSSQEIVQELVVMLRGKAHSLRPELKMPNFAAVEIATACLAWHRDSACKPCGGHGFLVMPGVPVMSDKRCPVCRGDGRRTREFEKSLRPEWREIARWLIAEMESEMGRAGPAAMAAIAPSLDF